MPKPPVEFAHVLLSHRPLVDKIVKALTARHRMTPADVEDFTATVHLRLIEDDYAVLRAYAGRSDWSTYLFAVIRRTLQDWHRTRWGRWRPSRTATRLGPAAVLIERLVALDGHRVSEAIDMMRGQYGIESPVEELETLAAQLPMPPPRTFVSDDALAQVPSPAHGPEAAARTAQVSQTAMRVAQMLQAALARLPSQDRLILQLRFEQDLSMAAIGRVVGVDGKALYRRVDRLLAALRTDLLEGGVAAADVNLVLSEQGFDHDY